MMPVDLLSTDAVARLTDGEACTRDGESPAVRRESFAMEGEFFATHRESFAMEGEFFAAPRESFAMEGELFAAHRESFAMEGEFLAPDGEPRLHPRDKRRSGTSRSLGASTAREGRDYMSGFQARQTAAPRATIPFPFSG